LEKKLQKLKPASAPHSPLTYTIGTRGSLLSRTQTSQLQAELEQNSNVSFATKYIATTGDLQTQAPLWQLDGQNFFTKELDTALLQKEVDFVVHSYKDLGSDRPQGISMVAITKRKYPHDILLIKKDTAAKISTIRHLRVGTSSPRRKALLEQSLCSVIPTASTTAISSQLELEIVSLRGNVNTRIQKLKNGEYDCIVLALAGIERLANSPESKQELEILLAELTFLVLPLSLFPGAAAQGALAVEMREEELNSPLARVLKSVENADTAEEVTRERKAFRSFGGGCHLPMGLHVRKINNHFIHIYRGLKNDKAYEEISLERPLPVLPIVRHSPIEEKAFVGFPVSKMKTLDKKKAENKYLGHDFLWDELIEKQSYQQASPERPIDANAQLFVTTPYAIPALKHAISSPFKGSLWAAGQKTCAELLKLGHWVSGLSDLFGYSEIQLLQESQALKIMLGDQGKWQVLTNDTATSSLGETVPCYTRTIQKPSAAFAKKFSSLKIFYWSSFWQYQQYAKSFPFLLEGNQLQHCCGMGKTLDEFEKNGIEVIPFLTVPSFQQWVCHESNSSP
jgi:hydroxymethylbilane synthase